MENTYFVQRIEFNIEGCEEEDLNYCKNKMLKLYSLTVDFMNDGGIKEFNNRYDQLTDYPMDIELYDELFDRVFVDIANKISDMSDEFLCWDYDKRIYLGERSAFIFDPNTEVTTMKGYIR